jgi:hypothetical protein
VKQTISRKRVGDPVGMSIWEIKSARANGELCAFCGLDWPSWLVPYRIERLNDTTEDGRYSPIRHEVRMQMSPACGYCAKQEA